MIFFPISVMSNHLLPGKNMALFSQKLIAGLDFPGRATGFPFDGLPEIPPLNKIVIRSRGYRTAVVGNMIVFTKYIIRTIIVKYCFFLKMIFGV
jgi:hypothetical protein